LQRPISQYSRLPRKTKKDQTRKPRWIVVKKRISLDRRGIGAHQFVARAAQLVDQQQFAALEILDAAPGEVAGVGADAAGKITASTSATRTPRPASAAADTAPLIPPPTISTS
jgi:hypothetical protein